MFLFVVLCICFCVAVAAVVLPGFSCRRRGIISLFFFCLLCSWVCGLHPPPALPSHPIPPRPEVNLYPPPPLSSRSSNCNRKKVSRMLDLAASLGRHGGPVTCASMCMGSGSAVTGGADGKVLVWDIRRKVRAAKGVFRVLSARHVCITRVSDSPLSLAKYPSCCCCAFYPRNEHLAPRPPGADGFLLEISFVCFELAAYCALGLN